MKSLKRVYIQDTDSSMANIIERIINRISDNEIKYNFISSVKNFYLIED